MNDDDDLPPQLIAQAAAGPPGLGDALRIWWAGVLAVTPAKLFASDVRLEEGALWVGDQIFELSGIRRIVVVGAGKASAGMATALYANCLRHLEGTIEVVGWINAPQGTFHAGSAGPIHLHAARPPATNEPTLEAVAGTQQILRLVDQCRSSDLCIVLLSGGGSALLVAPIEGITLRDKQHVARKMAAAGANIEQLNMVRRALSRVKGGGLASLCRARHLVALIISDVLGDPLETIASGPTVLSAASTPQAALEVLEQFSLEADAELSNVVSILRQCARTVGRQMPSTTKTAPVSNIILANNATAVDAAGVKAVELGYRYIMQAARTLEGDVTQLAETVGHVLEQLSNEPQVDCWISGGEPTVKLPPETIRGRGGRNQQLVLLSMLELVQRGWPDEALRFPQSLLFLSAGTDGEDGPTSAAGAWCDAGVYRQLVAQQVDPRDFARRADAATLFSRLNCLIESQATGTNVCDLRIALKPKPLKGPLAPLSELS